MSGETRQAISGWTVDTLKEHFEQQLAGLSAALLAHEKLAIERDRLYKERDDARRVAVDAALAAAKEQTASSFTASEKAIVKAETAQSEYNVRSNEFRGQLDDQAKRLISRTEVDSVVKNLTEKIDRIDLDVRSLRESRGERAGEGQGGRAVLDTSRSNIALLVSALAVALLLWRAFVGR